MALNGGRAAAAGGTGVATNATGRASSAVTSAITRRFIEPSALFRTWIRPGPGLPETPAPTTVDGR